MPTQHAERPAVGSGRAPVHPVRTLGAYLTIMAANEDKAQSAHLGGTGPFVAPAQHAHAADGAANSDAARKQLLQSKRVATADAAHRSTSNNPHGRLPRIGTAARSDS